MITQRTYEQVLASSHAVFNAKARTFSHAARLLPPGVHDDAAIVYALCRLIDDTADQAPSPEVALAGLDAIARELTGEAEARDLVGVFLETARRLNLNVACALELIEGARWDQREVLCVEDDAELLRYCYRVAGTVGLMMCAVLGVVQDEALPFALDLGVAMQLTNICRDVAEDASMQRVYLPARRLRLEGVEPSDLLHPPTDRAEAEAARQATARVVGHLLSMADSYYESATHGMRHIPARCRGAILVAARVYGAIGHELRARGCDALAGRTILTTPQRLRWTARALAEAASPRVLGLSASATHDATLHVHLHDLPGANPLSARAHQPAPEILLAAGE